MSQELQPAVLKKHSALRDQIPRINIITVPMTGHMPVRLTPGRQSINHFPHLLPKPARCRPVKTLQMQQTVQKTVQHLPMIHRTLLPLRSVPENLQMTFFIQTPHRLLNPAIFPEIKPQKQQPMILKNPPVAQPVKRKIHLQQIPRMLTQTNLHPFPDFLRKKRTVIKQSHTFQPELNPNPRFQTAPRPIPAFRSKRSIFQPILQKRHKLFSIFQRLTPPCFILLPAPIPPCLPQNQKTSMPVQRIKPFRIPERNRIPFNFIPKNHSLMRPLHLPMLLKNKTILQNTIRLLQTSLFPPGKIPPAIPSHFLQMIITPKLLQISHNSILPKLSSSYTTTYILSQLPPPYYLNFPPLLITLLLSLPCFFPCLTFFIVLLFHYTTAFNIPPLPHSLYYLPYPHTTLYKKRI